MMRLKLLPRAEGLAVIEDAAQSIGGSRQGKMCGHSAWSASTSFYPAKPLGCYGDGGAMFTNDDAMADALRSFAFHGKGESQYDNVRVGLNSRLDTIQAAILIEKLAILEDEMQARQRVAQRYAGRIGRRRQDGNDRQPVTLRHLRSMRLKARTAMR